DPEAPTVVLAHVCPTGLGVVVLQRGRPELARSCSGDLKSELLSRTAVGRRVHSAGGVPLSAALRVRLPTGPRASLISRTDLPARRRATASSRIWAARGRVRIFKCYVEDYVSDIATRRTSFGELLGVRGDLRAPIGVGTGICARLADHLPVPVSRWAGYSRPNGTREVSALTVATPARPVPP